MANIITISDFAPYRSITANIDSTKHLDPYILEAQELDLRPLLGDELYIDLLDDFEASPSLQEYSDLYNGSTYTINSVRYKHEGIIPIMCYYTYARYLSNAQVKNTAFGIVSKKTEYSDPVDAKTIATLVANARSAAVAYQNRLIDFMLLTNVSLYKGTAERSRQGLFKIRAIVAADYRDKRNTCNACKR